MLGSEHGKIGTYNMRAKHFTRNLSKNSGISQDQETEFHKKLDTLVHDTFGKRKDEVEEGWGRGNDRVSLPDEPSLYWSGKGPLQNEYNELYEKLVPSQGAADTIEGEVLRAASKIVYRHYNDGDEFNQASFDQLIPYIGKVTSYDDLAHKSTEFAIKANGNYTPNTGWDSLDVMEYGPEEYDDDDYDEDDGWDEEEEDTSWDQDDDDEDLEEVIDPELLKAAGVGLATGALIPAASHLGYKAGEKIDKWLDKRSSAAAKKEYEAERQARLAKKSKKGVEEAVGQTYTVIVNRRDRERPVTGTIPELLEYFGYTLEVGKSYERERGRYKINMQPKNIQSLVDNLNKAASNGAANGAASTYYSVGEQVDEDWKKNLGTAALGAALAFGGAKAANAGQGPEAAPQQAKAAATQQAAAQNPYHNDLGVLVGVAQSKGGIQVLGKILSADQIQQVKAAYAKAKADPNLAKSAQFKQGQQLGFELGNSYADSSSQQMTDLNKRGPSYAGILSPMMVKPGEARSAEDITKVNQANAGKLKQAVTGAYGNLMAGGLEEGWESGPDERAPRERDPDWEYDQRRQEKLDIEAEKAQAQRPQEQYYTLVGRGPNYEANYAFPGEYDSLDAADAARSRLMADPKTPNPRDIGISKRTRYLDIKEGRETPLRDLEDYRAKKKALQDIQTDPNTAQDKELSTEVIRRLAGLEKQKAELKK